MNAAIVLLFGSVAGLGMVLLAFAFWILATGGDGREGDE